MEFKTKWNSIPTYSIPNSGEIKVEKAGYIPIRDQINQMLLAGRRLNEYRKEFYDSTNPRDDIDVDPTRSPDYDLADAFTDSHVLEEKFIESKKNRTEREKEDTKKEPEKAPHNASDVSEIPEVAD